MFYYLFYYLITVTICCHNTDLVHVNGHDRIILVTWCLTNDASHLHDVKFQNTIISSNTESRTPTADDLRRLFNKFVPKRGDLTVPTPVVPCPGKVCEMRPLSSSHPRPPQKTSHSSETWWTHMVTTEVQ